MKSYLSTLLTLTCAVLVIVLFMIKGGDNKQHENDIGTIAGLSNRLDSAQTQLAICDGTIMTLSNNLNQSESVSLTISNQYTEAQSTIAQDGEQITNLTQRLSETESQLPALNQRIVNLTNQAVSLAAQLTSTQTNLDRVNRDYVLIEDRLRRDVAERVIVERKFDNLLELQARMRQLKKHPVEMVSADSIYAGLDVEVRSNAFHVVSPN